MNAETVLSFWFEENSSEQWFTQSEAFDAAIVRRFGATWQAACAGELAAWRADARGRLAEIIVLDQFSRNMWRGHAKSFAQDGMALALAQYAVQMPEFVQLNEVERQFTLMPLMHSESLIIHQHAVPLFRAFAPPSSYDFELKHKAIIERFGRYPHRNAVLGRESTAEEIEFLKQPNSSF